MVKPTLCCICHESSCPNEGTENEWLDNGAYHFTDSESGADRKSYVICTNCFGNIRLEGPFLERFCQIYQGGGRNMEAVNKALRLFDEWWFTHTNLESEEFKDLEILDIIEILLGIKVSLSVGQKK